MPHPLLLGFPGCSYHIFFLLTAPGSSAHCVPCPNRHATFSPGLGQGGQQTEQNGHHDEVNIGDKSEVLAKHQGQD